jgi:hypothetical protein
MLRAQFYENKNYFWTSPKFWLLRPIYSFCVFLFFESAWSNYLRPLCFLPLCIYIFLNLKPIVCCGFPVQIRYRSEFFWVGQTRIKFKVETSLFMKFVQYQLNKNHNFNLIKYIDFEGIRLECVFLFFLYFFVSLWLAWKPFRFL